MLAKYYPSLGHGVTFSEQVVNWIETHMECSPNFGKMDLQGDRCFDLFTESDARFNELYQPSKPTP